MANNESKLSLENAKWAAKELKRLPPQARVQIMLASNRRNFPEFEKVALENGILNIKGVWEGIEDIKRQRAQGVNISIDNENENRNNSKEDSKISSRISTGAGIGMALLDRNSEYKRFNKFSKKYAEDIAKEWEKKYGAKFKTTAQVQQTASPKPLTRFQQMAQPGKKISVRVNSSNVNWGTLIPGTNKDGVEEISPHWTRARTKEEAFQLALLERYDRLAQISPATADEWVRKFKDPEVEKAIARKKAFDTKLRAEWESAFTPSQLNDPKTRSIIENGIRQRRRPTTVTSKGITQQNTNSVLSNSALDKNDPNKITEFKKILEKKTLSQKDLDILLLDNSERIKSAEKLLGRNLTSIEKIAILNAHFTGFGETGKSGGPAGAYNYTQEQLAKKAQILNEAGFDRDQRRQIIESGIAGHDSGQPNRSAWTPFIYTLPGSPQPNSFENDQSSGNQPPPKGLRKKLSYYSPGQIRNRTAARVKNRALNSKIGQSFQKTLLGKFTSKLNLASNKLKKLRKFLDPISYLEKLFLRSAIGSVASAIGGFLTSALSAIAGVVVSVATTAIGIASIIIGKVLAGIGASFTAVGLPILVVLAFVLLIIVALIAILFAPASGEDTIPEDVIVESPYAGISYFKVGPKQVLNGENITYQIGLIHDSREAKCDLEDITFVDAIPPQSTLVEGSELTTGSYRIDSDPETIVKWKLTENLASSKGFAPMSFTFKITINPEDDVTITNRIYIEGCAAEISTPDDSGDLFEGANSPPTTDDCGNANYASIMGTIRRRFNVNAANFGDPLCNFSLEKLRQVLSRFESDPEKVDFFVKIAQCESVGNGPNGYGSSNNTWGHFQMDSSYTNGRVDPFKPWNEEKNTKGDVPWQRQAQNAVSYNKVQAGLGNNFEAWQTAYCFCYYPKYRNNRKLCGDIDEARKIQTPAECNNSCIPRIVNN